MCKKRKKPKSLLPCGRMGKPVDHSDGAEGDNDGNDAGESFFVRNSLSDLLSRYLFDICSLFNTRQVPQLPW